MPHPGHCLTRAIKDVFPRYRTMRGYYCERKAGWDTHGLPVEVEVCKELGIHAKEEIEAYGIEPFIHRCQQSVWRYMQEWERLTERIGFWIRLDQAYVTYHQSYVESVWWSLKNLFDRGLLYQGHKIVWWWAQGGTALSAGEVGQGYREVADPSVYVRFPLVLRRASPATRLRREYQSAGLDHHALDLAQQPVRRGASRAGILGRRRRARRQDRTADRRLGARRDAGRESEARLARGRQAARREADRAGGMCRRLIITIKQLGDQHRRAAGSMRPEHRRQVILRGALSRQSLSPPIAAPASCIRPRHSAKPTSRCCRTSRRASKSGEGPELICAVAPDGKFTAEAPDYQGRWVKECDRDISRELRHRGLLWHQEQYLHDYPFCWRADEDPLIQYPRQSWFIRTSQFKEQMLANNEGINWLPEHIKDGRFGNFLATNVDWALSRDATGARRCRFGCATMNGCNHSVAIENYADLLARPGLDGTEVWVEAKQEESRAGRRSEDSQALYRRGHV